MDIEGGAVNKGISRLEATLTDDPILACEAALRQAQLDGDVAALDRLIDDALVFTTLEGTVVGKADDLDLHRSGRLRITRMDPSDRHVLRLGTTAVVSVRMEAAAIVDGVAVSGAMRYTRVWCERQDGWRVVAGHMSHVQE
jgi:ketosteroid isomerase-like protein